MNTASVLDATAQLSDNLHDLERTLQPLLTAALSETTKKLPLLDRAKLYTTIVYAIESLLFSYLRLHAIDAKSHAVFKELTRVKQYFAKIAEAEANVSGSATPTKRENLSLNKPAAGRFIKAALAGNKKYDAELAARKISELASAKRKLQEMEERRERKLKEKKKARESGGGSEEGVATPMMVASSGDAQSSEGVDAEIVASAIAKVKEEIEAKAEAAAEAQAEAQVTTDSSLLDPPTPESTAQSELTDSSKATPRKSKKKRKADREKDNDTPSAKKKRKSAQGVSANS